MVMTNDVLKPQDGAHVRLYFCCASEPGGGRMKHGEWIHSATFCGSQLRMLACA